jgi:hypothetical protein
MVEAPLQLRFDEEALGVPERVRPVGRVSVMVTG